MGIPEYFSLTHPNAQVDNAWYWRNTAGNIECGLLDWGGVQHGSIPVCMGNGWMGAEAHVMSEIEGPLIRLFIDEYEKMSGFRFDFDDLRMHIKLAQATALFGCCANIGMLLRIIRTNEWKDVQCRSDPRIDENFLIRCYYVQIELFLGMWRMNSPYEYFQRWLTRTKLPRKV